MTDEFIRAAEIEAATPIMAGPGEIRCANCDRLAAQVAELNSEAAVLQARNAKLTADLSWARTALAVNGPASNPQPAIGPHEKGG